MCPLLLIEIVRFSLQMGSKVSPPKGKEGGDTSIPFPHCDIMTPSHPSILRRKEGRKIGKESLIHVDSMGRRFISSLMGNGD